MITSQKPHLIPPHVLKLQALYYRLPKNHPRFPNLEQRIRNELSGLYGESRLYYPLSKLPTYHRTIPNIRLFLHPSHFQIDFLVVTPKFLLILESKYYSDDLIFDDTVHQVIQQKDQSYRVFEDPVLQAEEQSYQLSLWLEKNGYDDLPIEYFVVMTNPQTRLRIEPSNNHHAEKVISLQRLPSLFRELNSKHEKNYLTQNEIKNLTTTLIQNHRSYLPNILELNKITPNEILKGVFCMKCANLGMRMTNRYWQCDTCGHRDRYAHENTLKDYFLLIGDEINNQEFRSFAYLNARTTAKDMLKRTATNISGIKRSTKYKLFYDYNTNEFDYLSELRKLRNL
ncbi:nuclease-related domain-containing protein [Allobacillus sp. GCM10007491]|uniref:NERD domain-containing protein n=1 Tax=Allobacillus saliphilus TaxID=2912308 RepID=A0A941CWS2_9BACI|nr:nuclease-related domain-containing protein [Allobacillus saliphilus]MBR7554075.1 NERD domain-containing protein [Allobacillus saliphilus]